LSTRDLCRALLLAAVITITWLALTPRPPPLADTGADKINHLLAFTALSFTAWFGFPGARRAAMATLLVYGGLIEVAQSFVPARSAEWADVAADATGIALGSLLAAAVGLMRRRRGR
jgi:VanZ family protein